MKYKNSKTLKIYITLGTIILLLFLSESNIHQVKADQQKEYDETNGEIVVLFHNEIKDNELKLLTSSFNTPVEVVRHIGDYALLFIREADQYQNMIDNLSENPLVQAVQANNNISIFGFSNDTYANAQWAIDNPGYYINLSEAGREEKSAVKDVDMDVVEAWQQFDGESHDKREVVVAIIDTGVDYEHPDLADHMWVNQAEIPSDKIDNDNNGYIDDIYGWDFYNSDSSVCHYKYSQEYKKNLADPKDNDDHGTHIAGIIGAVSNNNIGIAGVASNIDIKIMSLKINGGPNGTGSISGAVEAIKYATMMGADICNMSWGTSQYSSILEQIMKESDMLFVAAAGNSGSNNNSDPVYPASMKLDNLISVTFIDSSGELTKLSNYGGTTVDLAAPGEDIYSTIVGSYATMSGSSMAAPQVSAVAAILYAYGENLYPSNIKEVILNNVKTLPNLEGYMINPGIPSAYKAILSSDNLVLDDKAPLMSFGTIYKKGLMQIPISIEEQGGAGIRALKWIIGERNIWDFKRGMAGETVTDHQISVAKGGTYTFYATDYSGNETVETYEVKDDTSPPKIATSYTISNGYKVRTVTIKVSDTQSGIKRVKYMSGVKAVTDFLPAESGTQLDIKDGTGIFKVKKDGIYTVFATDNRGNNSLNLIDIKTVKATAIKFNRPRATIYEGGQYFLQMSLTPTKSTDKITYVSSDETIATVTSTGKIAALKEGKANISAKTSSGLTTVCTITVIKKATQIE